MIVLPMAGLSSRFFRAGYTLPKYMLKLHGHSVFAHALGSFSTLFGQERFLIICRDVYGTSDFVLEECEKLSLPKSSVDLVVLDKETLGQAETVSEGLRIANVHPSTPTTVFNIDTFRPNFSHPSDIDLTKVDGYLEVFKGSGNQWSFVLPDLESPSKFRVKEVAEKLRISNLCSDGLYHFRNAGLFHEIYEKVRDMDPCQLQGGERYVAPLYNIAISRGFDIRYTIVEARCVRFCGTPAEYEALRSGPAFGPTE